MTFFTARTPAGPSLRQMDGMVPVETLCVFPTHRLLNSPTPVTMPTLSERERLAIAAFARVRDSSQVPDDITNIR